MVPPTIALIAQHSSGAISGFLKIDNINGDVTQKGREGWIDVQSMQWSVKRAISSPSGGGREAGTPSISELVITKSVDRSSPPLFLNAVGGSAAIPTVKLELLGTSPTTGVTYLFYRLTLTDVLVSSLSPSATAGAASTSESVSLNFTRIKIEYFIPGSSTPVASAEYDLAKGTAN